MNWTRSFSSTEWIFVGLFILIYVIYILRIKIIGRKLKTNTNSFISKLLLRFSYFVLLLFALMGPNFGTTETEARSESKNIFFAFDLSKSMDATDLEPSRLEIIKTESIALLEKFHLNKIGLLVFNSEAEVLSPLTFDHDRVKVQMVNLKTSFFENGSTNFNGLFELVLKKFRYTKENKVLIICTDGETHTPPNELLLKKLKAQNIHIIFFLVGTTIGGKIPDGSGFLNDENDDIVLTKVDRNTPLQITNTTGGRIFAIDNSQSQSQLVRTYVENIVDLNKQAKKAITYNKYVYFLFPALLLILLDFLLTINVLKL
ncbi:MAG: VWA domain-containing protein [Leadbetterella sp.]